MYYMYKVEIAFRGACILPKDTGQVQIWSWSDDFWQLYPLSMENDEYDIQNFGTFMAFITLSYRMFVTFDHVDCNYIRQKKKKKFVRWPHRPQNYPPTLNIFAFFSFFFFFRQTLFWFWNFCLNVWTKLTKML
jgi:hypothetical protein